LLTAADSSHSIQIAQICMQQEKKEERKQAEETTTAYLKSISKRYQYTHRNSKNILARFVDIETGACLECGLVHGFSNIDEANSRRQRENKSDKSLSKLFWEAAV
jgi:hypothetical protein